MRISFIFYVNQRLPGLPAVLPLHLFYWEELNMAVALGGAAGPARVKEGKKPLV